MQTIHINVDDNYAAKIINILENLKGVMLYDFQVEQTVNSEDKILSDFIEAQQNSMSKTWDNEEDKVWDEL